PHAPRVRALRGRLISSGRVPPCLKFIFLFSPLPLPRHGPRGGYWRSCCCPRDTPTHTRVLLFSSTEFPRSTAWPRWSDLRPCMCTSMYCLLRERSVR